MLQLEGDRGLPHVAGRWMSRPALQTAMFSAGINIFVDEHTDAYVSSLEKVGSSRLMTSGRYFLNIYIFLIIVVYTSIKYSKPPRVYDVCSPH